MCVVGGVRQQQTLTATTRRLDGISADCPDETLPAPLFLPFWLCDLFDIHGYSTDRMPKSQRGRAGSHPRPVSCGFCRTRKLRCSRIAPCSNCVARGIACDLELPQAQPSNAPNTSENFEILERLRRLENLLIAQKYEEREQNGPISASLRLPVVPQPVSTLQDVDTEKGITWLGGGSIDQTSLVSYLYHFNQSG